MLVMGSWLCLIGHCLLGPSVAAEQQADLSRYEFTEPHMGVSFKLVLYAADAQTANKATQAAFARIKALNEILSDYDPQSELSRLSDTAGQGKKVPVSKELWHVLQVSEEISQLSEGAFDVTIGSAVKLWRRARRAQKMPDPQRLAAAMETVGYQQIKFYPAERAVELIKPGVRLDLGGIAKGYAADEALLVLKNLGITQALVAASGDIVMGDPPPEAKAWRVAIAPLDVNKPAERFLELSNCAVSTSGDAFQFVEIDGKRYSHILDPRTGLGLTTRSSVTVVAPVGIRSDSLASTVCILGPEAGMKLIEKLPQTAVLIVVGDEEQPQVEQCQKMEELLKVGE